MYLRQIFLTGMIFFCCISCTKRNDSENAKYFSVLQGVVNINERYVVAFVDSAHKITTEDDCRCENGAMKVSEKNRKLQLEFTACDTTYPYDRFQIENAVAEGDLIVLNVKSYDSGANGTVRITRVSENPVLLKVIRSDNTQSRPLFVIPAADSSRYDHNSINCDEDQG